MEELKEKIFATIDCGEFDVTDEVQVRTMLGFVENIPAESMVEICVSEDRIKIKVTTILDSELTINKVSKRVMMFDGISGKAETVWRFFADCVDHYNNWCIR